MTSLTWAKFQSCTSEQTPSKLTLYNIGISRRHNFAPLQLVLKSNSDGSNTNPRVVRSALLTYVVTVLGMVLSQVSMLTSFPVTV